jgi:hypothetical protein
MVSEIYYLIILNILVFFCGYFYGRTQCVATNTIGLVNSKNKNKSTFQNNDAQQSVSIDERKVVTKISTDNLEKKYDNIGETKKTDDNISSAINKLKNMKG